MKWATQELIHFDRVISAWLILRFIDPEAQFTFLSASQRVADDVTLFGVQGVGGGHDPAVSTFQRLLNAHSICDPGLALLGGIVADVIDHLMRDQDRSGLVRRGPFAAGVLALAEGTMLLSVTDAECLERSLPLYDALYARLQAQLAVERASSPTGSVLEQTMQLLSAARSLRNARTGFSPVAFANAVSVGPGRE